MSIPVTDEIIDALIECADELEAEIDNRYNAPDIHPALKGKYERDLEPVKRARAAFAVAGKDELTGALGAIYEIRKATGVGGKPMLEELAEAIKAKQTEAIRAAVLLEREECAKTVFLLDPFDCQLEAAAEKIRARPDPSEGA